MTDAVCVCSFYLPWKKEPRRERRESIKYALLVLQKTNPLRRHAGTLFVNSAPRRKVLMSMKRVVSLGRLFLVDKVGWIPSNATENDDTPKERTTKLELRKKTHRLFFHCVDFFQNRFW